MNNMQQIDDALLLKFSTCWNVLLSLKETLMAEQHSSSRPLGVQQIF